MKGKASARFGVRRLVFFVCEELRSAPVSFGLRINKKGCLCAASNKTV